MVTLSAIPLLTAGDLAIRLGAAAAAGALLGLDREVKHHSAGLRTFMLVSLGSAGFTLTGLMFIEQSAQNGVPVGDATRIIQSVATGIGFLGAGAIIIDRGRVRGLTTAAGLWLAASIGIAASAGFFMLTAMLTAAGLLTLVTLRKIEPEIVSRVEHPLGPHRGPGAVPAPGQHSEVGPYN